MLSGSIEWEHRPGEEFVIRIKPPVGIKTLAETRGHLRVARKEILLAIKSLIDAALTRLEASGKTAEKGPTKIEVE